MNPELQEQLDALPRDNRGVLWASLSMDEIARAHAAAVALGDERMADLAHRALYRSCLREIRAEKGDR